MFFLPLLPVLFLPWWPGLLPGSDPVLEFVTATVLNGYLWTRLLTWRAGPFRLGLAAGLALTAFLLLLPQVQYLGGALAGGGGCGNCHRSALARTAMLPWALGSLVAVCRGWLRRAGGQAGSTGRGG